MPVMSAIAFRRTAPDESRIYCDGDHVGDVYALDDPLREAVRYLWCISTKTRAVPAASTTAAGSGR